WSTSRTCSSSSPAFGTRATSGGGGCCSSDLPSPPSSLTSSRVAYFQCGKWAEGQAEGRSGRVDSRAGPPHSGQQSAMATARAAGEVRPGGDRGTITVTVTLFADLRRFLPPGVDGPHRRTVASGATVANLMAAIGIPPEADVTVGLDGELADREASLRDGADV